MPNRRPQLPRRVLFVWLMLSMPAAVPLILHPYPDGWPLLGSWAALFSAGAVVCWCGCGWMLPCTLWGATFGWLLNPAFSGASIRPAWETLSPIIGGALFGLVLGLILDGVFLRSSNRTK